MSCAIGVRKAVEFLLRLSDCCDSPSGSVGDVHSACCNNKAKDSNERTTAEVAGGGGVVEAAVERGGERRRAGGGLNYRLLEPGSTLVDAGTTFVCQGGTASERRQSSQVPDTSQIEEWASPIGGESTDSSRFTALHGYGEIFAAAASLLPLPARDGQRTDSREHRPTVGSL